MQREHDSIREQLQAVFPTEPIHADDAFTQWGTTYPDAVPYKEQLEGKSWEQLDREYIVCRSDALGFLGTRHLVAVLPVYLRSLVEDGVWSSAADMMMLILTKPLPGKDTGLGAARFDEFVDALTDAQRSAVASALRAFGEQDPDGSLGQAAHEALEGYWNAYLPAGV